MGPGGRHFRRCAATPVDRYIRGWESARLEIHRERMADAAEQEAIERGRAANAAQESVEFQTEANSAGQKPSID